MQQSFKRIESLDILRGLDLFLLVFFQPVLMQICARVDAPWVKTIGRWFSHADWEGLHLWDMVMPLFLFMAGASMPFAFSKYRTAETKWPIYRKILKRFVILFILGMVVQGNLLGLDPQMFRFYSNTLQAIASGYLIASVLMLHLSLRAQIVATCLLMLIYWLPMHFCGNYTAEGNFAEMVDKAVLGRWRDGVYWDEQGQWHFSHWYHYTWVWSSLTFGVTVMLGTFAGQVIKAGGDNRRFTALRLAVIAFALLVLGYLHSMHAPVNKHLWTTSMTLISGGWCWALMAFFYWLVDVKGWSRGLSWLKIYGTNSIVAYMLGEVVNFRSVVQSVSYGLQPYLQDWYNVWLAFGNYLIIFFILRAMYKARVFVKI
ncbi:MAG: DUF5009 domain-containing protein [Bacteroidaceae bacterium]|nr:DUF5009 domain-containing protein [Bacteroidaceae bacterium]